MRKDRLSRWNASLDRNNDAIYRIRAWVRDRYADALARADQTLLEVTEGACHSVIKMRTTGGAQRWRPEGLTAVLTLRALHMSDRLPRFWANFARRYRKEVIVLSA